MALTRKLRFNADVIFHELDELAQDRELVDAVTACVQAQKRASAAAVQSAFQARPTAKHDVSEEALQAILDAGQEVNGIRTERHISNVIVFNDKAYADAVLSQDVAERRRAVDLLVAKRMERMFAQDVAVLTSGFFLYPAGGYMGWHTNWQSPGWRLYINYVEEAGKSFFRYRDPETHQIITSMDKPLNFRLFRVSSDKPLWHAIYSDTNRYSLGYKVVGKAKPSLPNRLLKRLSGVLKAS